MRKRIGMATMTLLALSTMAFMARADEEKISVENLPAAVKKAIKKKFPKAEIEKATKEVEDGKTTYEVLLEIEDRPVDVAFKADGTILEIEREIPLESSLPKSRKPWQPNIPGPRSRRSRWSPKVRMGRPSTRSPSRPRSS